MDDHYGPARRGIGWSHRHYLGRVLWGGLGSLAASVAAAQQVTDGDTIKHNGVTWRLWGIDAPELSQVCPDGWPAGRLSSSRLQKLMAGKAVVCETQGSDRYGRSIGKCFAGGADLSAAMVRDGMALAFTRYSSDYVLAESAAKTDRLGLHAHDCPTPWDYRASRR